MRVLCHLFTFDRTTSSDCQRKKPESVEVIEMNGSVVEDDEGESKGKRLVTEGGNRELTAFRIDRLSAIAI